MLSGGSAYVYKNGSVFDVDVDVDACLFVATGGTALQIKENGGYVDI